MKDFDTEAERMTRKEALRLQIEKDLDEAEVIVSTIRNHPVGKEWLRLFNWVYKETLRPFAIMEDGIKELGGDAKATVMVEYIGLLKQHTQNVHETQTKILDLTTQAARAVYAENRPSIRQFFSHLAKEVARTFKKG